MADKKISQFPGRSAIAAAVAGTLVNQPEVSKLGGDQGAFVREPCGTCISWRRVNAPGSTLNSGMCMRMPYIAAPVYQERGGVLAPVGQVLIRPQPPADAEGCDEHDDGSDDEDDGDGSKARPSVLAQAG